MVEMITYDPEIFNETWNKISNVTEKRMKKYRVETQRLVGLSQHDVVECRNGLCECIGSGYTFDEGIIDRNPEWFTPVEEEVKEGQYWKHGNEVKRIMSVNGSGGLSVNYTIVCGNKNRSGGTCTKDYLLDVEPHKLLDDDAVEEQLIAEAKRRGLVKGARVDKEYKGHLTVDTITGSNYNYDAYDDALRIKSKNYLGLLIYMEGQWASIVDEPIQINGYEVEIEDLFVKVGCTHADKSVFRNLSNYSTSYDLSIHREGEDITKQIKKIAKRIES